MPRRVFDLELSEEFVVLMRSVAQGATRPVTDVEMLQRWLAHGLAYDALKPPVEAGQIINQFVRITRK